MFRLLRCKKGFTMVEILISMVIIAVLAMAFIPLFSTSFVNIFAYGERDRAMTAASDIMDHLYARQPFENENEEEIGEIITDELANGYEDFVINDDNDNKDYVKEKEIKGVKGYKVTIEVKYQNEERDVTLTSFVRGEP